jgi:glycosyltransferase involved in cell wall biosynthesis
MVKPVEKCNSETQTDKPFVSIVIPAYNEAAIVKDNLDNVYDYMQTLEDEYRWEIIFVDDGSTDGTGELAEKFAETRENTHIFHHFVNFQLGQALRFAFNNCKGDYIVVLDLDLSYSPDHIKRLLNAISKTKAKIVIASPYAKGGTISHVPFFRRMMSIWANRFLSLTAKGRLTSLTGMVRAYDRVFLNSLNLKAMDYQISPEIIYKAQLLRARITEIPGHLDWSFSKGDGKERRSSMKIARNIMSSLFTGFIFRPFMFFIFPGLILLFISAYPIFWSFFHIVSQYQKLSQSATYFDAGVSAAVRLAFQQSPHSFLVGGILLMVAIQLLSLGILALQNKRYFADLFHLGSTMYKSNKQNNLRS